MSLFSWLRSCILTRPPRARPVYRSTAPRFRPQLEALEERWLPSTLTVTSAADSGSGSLRADIAAAHSGDTIVFANSLKGQTITLSSGVLDINKNLTIQGLGASLLTISGNNSSTVFQVEANDQVALSGLTISNGSTTSGGGGIANAGKLTVSSCTLSNNFAYYGGAIANEVGATLTVSSSTVSGNKAAEYGGGIYSDAKTTLTITGSVLEQDSADIEGGGIWTEGTATVSSSTLSGDQQLSGTAGAGGGIFNAGSMSLLASTVTGCSADNLAGGIYNRGYLTIGNKSDVCDNTANGGTGWYESDLVNDGGTVKITGGSKVC